MKKYSKPTIQFEQTGCSTAFLVPISDGKANPEDAVTKHRNADYLEEEEELDEAMIMLLKDREEGATSSLW